MSHFRAATSLDNCQSVILYYLFIYRYIFGLANILRYVFDKMWFRHYLKWLNSFAGLGFEPRTLELTNF